MSHKNYNAFSNKQNKVFNNEMPSHQHAINVIDTIKNGSVINCDKLRLRKEPSRESEVLCLIDKKDSFKVYREKSVNNFYNVVTSDGMEGYCMKEFVNIMEVI